MQGSWVTWSRALPQSLQLGDISSSPPFQLPWKIWASVLWNTKVTASDFSDYISSPVVHLTFNSENFVLHYCPLKKEISQTLDQREVIAQYKCFSQTPQPSDLTGIFTSELELRSIHWKKKNPWILSWIHHASSKQRLKSDSLAEVTDM